MKHLLSLTLLLAALTARAAEGPAPNTLTPEEMAAGYTLLFDGQDLPGFRIRGDIQIDDGVLTLGGTRLTIATITTELPSNFELHMKYRLIEPPGASPARMNGVTLHLWQKKFLSTRGNVQPVVGSPLPMPEDGWDELFLTGESHPASDTFETTLRFAPEELAPHGGKSGWLGRAGNFTVSLEIPPGGKLYLRDVKLRADPVRWWQTPWLFLLVLLPVALVLGVIGLLILRRRGRVAGTGHRHSPNARQGVSFHASSR